jgi:starch synthase
MMDIIDYALSVYQDKEAWAGLVQRAMSAQLDWDKSANAYLKVFNSLLD